MCSGEGRQTKRIMLSNISDLAKSRIPVQHPLNLQPVVSLHIDMQFDMPAGSPVIYSGDIHSPVSTQNLQSAASVDVLPLSQGHQLLDYKGESAVPHVLPGDARYARVSEYVGIAKTQMVFWEWPMVLRATCKNIGGGIRSDGRMKHLQFCDTLNDVSGCCSAVHFSQVSFDVVMLEVLVVRRPLHIGM